MNPTVTIQTEATPRTVTNKQGVPKTIYFQIATVECPQLRMNIDVEIDGPTVAYGVGQTLEWDVIADLEAGQYSRIQLARRMTLRPLQQKPAAKVA